MAADVFDAIATKEITANKQVINTSLDLSGGDNLPLSGAYTIVNDVVDRALDANANDDLATADVLATLIKDLIAKGVIQAA